jgi:DNA topoisomerase II
VTGGTHGLGAKLTNIFSSSFGVEIYDSKTNTLYRQQWQDNMRTVTPPEITTAVNKGQSYTLISFCPDLQRLHTLPSDLTAHGKKGVKSATHNKQDDGDAMAKLDDVVEVMSRRVIDLCGVGLSGGRRGGAPIRVSLNGTPIGVQSMADYMSLFGIDTKLAQVIQVSDRWEVGVAPSPSGLFEHMAFVNSVWTVRGGTHVNYIASQCHKHIDATLSRLYNSTSPGLTAPTIKNQLMIFVRCLVENASFDSQSKDMLTTRSSNFGSQCVLPAEFLQSCFTDDGPIVSTLLQMLKARDRTRALIPTKGQFGKGSIDVPGLQDAHNAGDTMPHHVCLLILLN